MKTIMIVMLSVLIFPFSGCKKLVEVDSPETSVSSKNIYNNDATAIGVLTSLYVGMQNGVLITSPGQVNSLSCVAGLSADELRYYPLAGQSTLDAYFQNKLTKLNTGFFDYWGAIYQEMYVINSALEGLSAAGDLTPAVKQQLLGEARFMRAFYYFYLVNLYGDAPLVLTTDYTVNSLIAKSTKAQIYEQIVLDLKEAEKLLSEQYLQSDCKTAYPTGSEERVRPTKWAATALLARTYLFLKEWANAELAVTSLLAKTEQYQLESIGSAFLKNNKESIWQVPTTSFAINTSEGNTFILNEAGPSFENPVYLDESVVKDFETGDLRKLNWINKVTTNGITYYYPYKYKVKGSPDRNILISEYGIVMRLAEQYLIRAEAKAQQGNISGGVEDLDKIRERAGLASIIKNHPSINQQDLLVAILKERRLELFTEWGHRWFDLKRTGEIDKVMSVATPKKGNGAVWQSYQQYYPISLSELQSNPKLTPTPGY